MKIGILGSGNVGQVLAQAFFSEGHAVVLGTRNPEKPELAKWKSLHPQIAVQNFSQTAAGAELIVLAVEGRVAEEAVNLSGKTHLAGKIIIDATNPIAKQPPTKGVLHYFTTLEDSLMERLQRLVPDGKWVKAFNSVGHAFMYKPAFKEGKPTMFICGNDQQAKKTVSEILEKFGWDSADMGGVESARAIEPLCILWCIPGMLRNQWTHAFKLLHL